MCVLSPDEIAETNSRISSKMSIFVNGKTKNTACRNTFSSLWHRCRRWWRGAWPHTATEAKTKSEKIFCRISLRPMHRIVCACQWRKKAKSTYTHTLAYATPSTRPSGRSRREKERKKETERSETNKWNSMRSQICTNFYAMDFRCDSLHAHARTQRDRKSVAKIFKRYK